MEIVIKGDYIEVRKANLKVVLSRLGASIVEIKYDDDLMTMTPINYDDLHREDVYYGKTIGPIANRIKDGLVIIDNNQYYLPLNENGICNHSGKIGLSNQIFDVSVENGKVIFVYKSIMFGGEISYKVAYSFLLDNQILVDYYVKTTNKAVLSLTNHSFFTLGESNIDNLSLRFFADEYIESDKDTLLPLSIKPIIACLDFNKEKPIIKDINDPYLTNHKSKGYDHCFLLHRSQVILKSLKYSLIIKSNYPCLQIYSDNYPDDVLVKNSKQSIRRAIAIEPEDNLLEKTLVTEDDLYRRYISYTFLKR